LAGRVRREVRRRVASRFTYENLPHEAAVRLSYEIMLGREPDPEGTRYFLENLASGGLKITEVPQAIRGSEEFQNFVRFSGSMLGFSIHAGRSQFIKSLPKASTIVDLGGTHLARVEGALYWLGYPYEFTELTIIDLHPDDRHAIYKAGLNPERVETDLGPVRYRYHSMTDLSSFADSSVDLIYSGQSIEHVTPDDGQIVLKEALRILRPGGHMAIDTPNGRLTRVQQEAFIDPDHKVEYTYPELRDLLTGAGFEIATAKGLNLGQRSVATGVFDGDEVAGHSGLFDEIEDCYILCVVARKPA
jgi:predicted SAM-dependent methyltransferase